LPVDNLHALEELRHRRTFYNLEAMDATLSTAGGTRPIPRAIFSCVALSRVIGSAAALGAGLHRPSSSSGKRWLTERNYHTWRSRRCCRAAPRPTRWRNRLLFGGCRGAARLRRIRAPDSRVMALAFSHALGTTPDIETSCATHAAVVGIIAPSR